MKRENESNRARPRAIAGAALALTLVVAFASGCSERESAECASRPTLTLAEFKAEIERTGVWSGGPPPYFEGVGRNTLATAIEQGLMPEHLVLDIGAGSLRVGWWFLHYIEPANYYAIEVVKERINTAVEILGVNDINVYYNDDFGFPDEKFDFVIARSIWTHASKGMISKMLSEFAARSNPDAAFLTSVLFATSEEEEYMGDEWIGRIEKDGRPGFVRHSKEWLESECQKNGLSLEVVGELYRQTWLVIRPANPSA